MAEAKQYLVLSALGTDRPGIVAEVTEFLDQHGANVEDSRMAILGGEFALMMLVSGTPEEVAAVCSGIHTLERTSGLQVFVKPTDSPYQHRSRGAVPYVVHAYAMDHEGIVHAIASALSRRGVNIVSLETSTYPAPISGTPLFRMELHMDVPQEVSLSHLRQELERVAETENVDIELHPE